MKGDHAVSDNDPQNELAVLKVEEKRMELAARKRELVPLHGLRQFAEQARAAMHSALETLPDQIKTQLPYLRAAEVKQIRQLNCKDSEQHLSCPTISQLRACQSTYGN